MYVSRFQVHDWVVITDWCRKFSVLHQSVSGGIRYGGTQTDHFCAEKRVVVARSVGKAERMLSLAYGNDHGCLKY
jgi:hypothetical protein